MKSYILLCLLLVSLCSADLFTQEENGVIVLDDKNFKQITSHYSNLLVDFYAPWCGKCTTFAPRFEKACQTLKESDPPVYCAKIDADKYKEIAEEYKVVGFPTLIHFKQGKTIRYEGAIKEHAVVSWVKTGKSEPSIKLNWDDLVKMVEDEHVFFAYIGPLDGKEFKMWEMIAKFDDHRVFAHSDDEKIINRYKLDTPTVVAFRKFDDPVVKLEGDFERLNIMNFVREKGVAECAYFSEIDKINIFRAKQTALFLIVDEIAEPRTLDTFCNFAKNDQSEMLYSWVSMRNKEQFEVREYIDVHQRKAPILVIVHFDVHYGLMRYEFEGNVKHLTPRDLNDFIRKFKQGALERHYYDDQDKQWYHVTAAVPLYHETYEEIVMNQESDVLVYYFSTEDSVNTGVFYHREIDQISKEIGRPDDLILTRYDWHKAPPVDHPLARPNTIILYPKNDKNKGIEYSGEKSVEKIREFLQDHSAVYREKFAKREDL